MPSGVEDINAAGARYKDLAAGGADTYLAVVDFALCAAPDNPVGRGIEDRYLLTRVWVTHTSGCFVVGDTRRFDLLTGLVR